MVLDVMLVVLAVLAAVMGYRQGFVVGVLNVVGLVAGALAGMWAAPLLAGRVGEGARRALLAVVIVLVASTIGQLTGAAIGGAIRRRMHWRPVRRVDSTAGSVVSMAGAMLIAWLIATQIKDLPIAVVSAQVHRSRVLQAVGEVMPRAPEIPAPFRRLMSRPGFPQVFSGLDGARRRSVPAPDPAVLASPAVVRSRQSIVRVTGVAKGCARRLEGTGFVYADDYVMTNAHVVAGVRAPTVTTEQGKERRGIIVFFDPVRDVAIVYVDKLGLTPLEFAGVAQSGDSAVVAGYPEDGPFTAVAARVRNQVTAVGRDIYERESARRDVYAIRAKVLPGNSGGPLLAPDGRVYGLVFASAADDPETGYALTAGEVSAPGTLGRLRTTATATGACA